MGITVFDSDRREKNDVVFKEQRSLKRHVSEIAVDFSITGTTAHTFYAGFTQDISEGGVFVATHQTYPIGSSVKINLDIAGTKIEVEAIVRWIKNADTFAKGDVDPGMGLQFVNLTAATKGVIDAFLQKREPMFVDVD
ncbi:TIGR02266 family protein [bacterium]|nr:TIGR02266 family protein [bacterium]